jgi:16S rRNA (cytosine967-C5)-methyltransferase
MDRNLNPRVAVARMLAGVLGRGLPLDETPLSRLRGRDRGFARALAATTLRRLGQIDAIVATFLEHPPKDAALMDLLRLGACQSIFMGTPPHAAVSTTVDLAAKPSQKKLLNAVLRRIAAEGPGLALAQDPARLNTPDWLWDSWTAAYGEDTCRLIAAQHLDEPPLDLTLKKGRWALADTLSGTWLATGSLRLAARGPISQLPGYAAGNWWVQDAAAALPATLLGDVDGLTVIDLCAAPGGKTAQLAAAGARVTAVDRAPKRVRRLKENLSRLALKATVVEADATRWLPPEQASAVLVDAPCSATGTIRRHPDIARLKTPAEVKTLTEVQDRLLTQALDMVKPGGVIVYCACSLEPDEGPARISKMLGQGAPVERMPISAGEVGGLDQLLTAEGDLRTLPFHMEGGMDGFYAARLKRL